jgi:hypothetical protein
VTAPGTSVPGALHPSVEPLAFLLGRWAGEGEGFYPTIEPFRYGEEITVAHSGKPYLAYAQRTWDLDDGRPLHAETGYWRCPSPARAELVIAHSNGLVEVSEGALSSTTLALSSTTVAGTATAKDVRALARHVAVTGERLEYTLEMAAVGVSLTEHLRAVLRRVAVSPG